MLCFHAQKNYKFNLVLLDGRQLQFTYKSSQSCSQLVSDVCKLCNFTKSDMEYFGFRYYDLDLRQQWLNLNKTVHSQFKYLTSDELVVYLSVKYYTPDPCKLSEATRYLFYLQLRKDILTSKLPLNFDYARDLFSYFLQSEIGDFNPSRDTFGYASEFEFIANQSLELETAVENKHAKLRGMSQTTAEMNFLNKAKWLDMYGVEMEQAIGEDNVEYSIGLTPTGIAVFKNMLRVSSYFWPRITRLNYRVNKFELTVIENTNAECTHVFTLPSKSICKSLWKSCTDQHRFFQIKAVYKEPALLRTASVTNKRITSDRNKPSQFCFERVPVKRVARRNAEDPLGADTVVVGDGLVFRPVEQVAELQTKSPVNSCKSVSSYRRSKNRRQSAESEANSRRKNEDRNRSRTRREAIGGEDSDNQNKVANRQVSATRRVSGGRRRSNQSRGMGIHASGANLIMVKSSYEASCHETSADENDLNEMEKKRQIRRRKRSKSPGGTTKPPEEILQHIKYNLVEQTGLNADQLKEIPFVNIETSAAPFRISPHQKHRRYSPGRRRSGDIRDDSDPKKSILYMSNGTAHIKKTNKFLENLNAVAVPHVSANPVSMGSAINTKLTTKEVLCSLEPSVNVGFSADSGCEDLIKIGSSSD